MPYSHDCLQIMLALVQYWMGQQQLLPRQKQACMYVYMYAMHGYKGMYEYTFRCSATQSVGGVYPVWPLCSCLYFEHRAVICILYTGNMYLVYYIYTNTYSAVIQLERVFFLLIRPFFDVLFVLQLWSLLFYTHADPDKNLV